jgi:hypothetical protein
MLNINSETVCFLIERAREFQVHQSETRVDDEPTGSDALGRDASAEVSDPTYRDFRSTIKDLDPDQQVEVVAMMWLGRGDFSVEEWPQALQQAGDSWNRRTAEYLIGTPLVADYLLEGLQAHGLGCD